MFSAIDAAWRCASGGNKREVTEGRTVMHSSWKTSVHNWVYLGGIHCSVYIVVCALYVHEPWYFFAIHKHIHILVQISGLCAQPANKQHKRWL